MTCERNKMKRKAFALVFIVPYHGMAPRRAACVSPQCPKLSPQYGSIAPAQSALQAPEMPHDRCLSSSCPRSRGAPRPLLPVQLPRLWCWSHFHGLSNQWECLEILFDIPVGWGGAYLANCIVLLERVKVPTMVNRILIHMHCTWNTYFFGSV